jgi:hypothetical protein
MLTLLSTTLRQLLVKALPADDPPKEISFEQPTREASARWSRPAINLYLYDVRENARLRNMAPPWDARMTDKGLPGERRKPVRLDAHYLLTVWGNSHEDEEYLLNAALMALFRSPCLDDSALENLYGEGNVPAELLDQPAPITLQVAQNDDLQKPSDLWSVLSNDLRPAIPITVTFALQPFDTLPTRPVRQADTRFISQSKEVGRSTEFFFSQIGGRLSVKIDGKSLERKDMSDLRMKLVERDEEVPVDDDWRYRLRNLQRARYTLEISAAHLPSPQRTTLTVPAASYDIEIDAKSEAAGAGGKHSRK